MMLAHHSSTCHVIPGTTPRGSDRSTRPRRAGAGESAHPFSLCPLRPLCCDRQTGGRSSLNFANRCSSNLRPLLSARHASGARPARSLVLCVCVGVASCVHYRNHRRLFPQKTGAAIRRPRRKSAIPISDWLLKHYGLKRRLPPSHTSLAAVSARRAIGWRAAPNRRAYSQLSSWRAVFRSGHEFMRGAA